MHTQYITPSSWPTTAKARARCLARDCQGKQNGSQWSAYCPAHDDENPSLRIKTSDDGTKVLIKCHAGCTPKAILRECNLPLSYLSLQSLETQEADSFTSISLKELSMKPLPKQRWIVENLLPVGGLVLLAGKPKSGKSTLARQLAGCIATGKDFLGRKTHKGSVLYFPLEEIDTEVVRHFKLLGLTCRESINLYFSVQCKERIAPLQNEIEKYKPAIVIIDPLFRFLHFRDGNDYADVNKTLAPLMDVARQTHTLILCIHHTGKNDRFGGDSVLGSTAIFAAVDTLIILKETTQGRTLISEGQRYGTLLENTLLTFDASTNSMALGTPKHTKDITWMKNAILTTLTPNSQFTEMLLAQEIGGERAVRIKALSQLFTAKKISRIGKGRKGDPYKYALVHADSIHEPFVLYQPVSIN